MEFQEIALFLIDKVVLAVLIGVVSSAIFFFVLSRLTPKLEISPQIAKGRSTLDGATIYRIKVINRTKKPVTDIRAQLHRITSYQTKGGAIFKSKPLKLQRSAPLVIDKYDKKDPDAGYAYRFLTFEDLDSIWEDDTVQHLMFRIVCKHSLSGFGGVFKMPYRVKKATIKSGDFAKGDSFEIVER